MRSLTLGLANFWRDPAGRTVIAVAGTVIAIGTVFYRFVEDLRWIDSLYFCVITLTTVGFGDITPETTAGKVFTMGYVVVGVGVFVALVTTVAAHLVEARSELRDRRKS